MLYAALITALLALGGVSEHALDAQDATLRDGARAKASENARLVALSVRAAIATVEQSLDASTRPRGVTVVRTALPPDRIVPSAPDPPYGGRPRDELQNLLESRRATAAGLPEAVVAAIALGIPERRDHAAELLLEGDLPVLPEDLPVLAEALGHRTDARVAALAERLSRVPDLPQVPSFQRLRDGDAIVGDARAADVWIHYSVPVERLVDLAGAASKATVRLGTPAAGAIPISVPDVPDLELDVVAPAPPRLRLYALRALLVASVAGAIAGIVLHLSALRREARAMRRERQFLGNVTHELRTPLAAIRVLGETLAAGRGDPAQYGILVASETERLEALVEQVLAATRAEERPRFSATSLGDLVRSAMGLVKARAERRSVSLEADLPRELPPAEWDGDAVRRALLNLLDNAIRHGREGGHVRVTARADGGLVSLAVEDDGPGIHRKDRRRLFGRFERGPTNAPGTGLGLYLVEQVARSHGGRLDLATTEGRGSTFTLVLPLRPLAAREGTG